MFTIDNRVSDISRVELVEKGCGKKENHPYRDNHSEDQLESTFISRQNNSKYVEENLEKKIRQYCLFINESGVADSASLERSYKFKHW